MATLTIRVKKIDTIGACLVADNAATYLDTIVKNQNYNNTTSKSIKVNNICDTPFTLPAMQLFEQVDGNGSTFKATIVPTLIPANSSVQVPVYYNGIYKGPNTSPVYNFSINGSNIQYQLTVTIPEIPDTPGNITNMVFNKPNRVDVSFTIADFTSHFSDVDGDTITHVLFSGSVGSVRYNGLAYTTDTLIPIADVGLGKVVSVAPNVDTVATTNLVYKIKDNKGNIIA